MFASKLKLGKFRQQWTNGISDEFLFFFFNKQRIDENRNLNIEMYIYFLLLRFNIYLEVNHCRFLDD